MKSPPHGRCPVFPYGTVAKVSGDFALKYGDDVASDIVSPGLKLEAEDVYWYTSEGKFASPQLFLMVFDGHDILHRQWLHPIRLRSVSALFNVKRVP